MPHFFTFHTSGAIDLLHPSAAPPFNTFRFVSPEYKDEKFDDSVYFSEYMKDW
jgi:hypothetical protein